MALACSVVSGVGLGFLVLSAAPAARRAMRAAGAAAWAARAPAAWRPWCARWVESRALESELKRLAVTCCAQSHASYGRCGLGSEGTDRLVALVRAEAAAARAAGAEPPLYGAKITGGGSGGAQALTI